MSDTSEKISSISVILPTLGRYQLNRSLNSVVKQLKPYDELLVVIDGIGDVSEAVRMIQHYRAKYANVNILTHTVVDDESSYGWAQRNTGIKEASKNIIAFLDDDDMYLPCAIESIRREGSHGRPVIFRRDYSGMIMWSRPEMIKGEVGTGMFCAPAEYAHEMLIPMEMTKIEKGYTDFLWISAMIGGGDDSIWQPEDVIWSLDVIYWCRGHGNGQLTSKA